MPKIPDRNLNTKMFVVVYRYHNDFGWYAASWTFQSTSMCEALDIACNWFESNLTTHDWDSYEIISITKIDRGE